MEPGRAGEHDAVVGLRAPVDEVLRDERSPRVTDDDERHLIALFGPYHVGEARNGVERGTHATGPRTPHPVEVATVLLEARLAVATVIVGPHRIARRVQRLDELAVPSDVLSDAVGELDDGARVGHAPRLVVDAHAVRIGEGRHALHPGIRAADILWGIS